MAKIKIGIITRTVGVNGAFLVENVPDFLFSVRDGSIINIGFSLTFSKEYIILKTDKKNKGLQIIVEGIDSKEKANNFRDNAVFIDEDSIIKDNDKHYFSNEIIDCNVFDIDTNELIGKIIKEEDYPAHKIWTIEYHFKEVLVPVVEEIVKYIDIENKKVGIKIIPGLFEANL